MFLFVNKYISKKTNVLSETKSHTQSDNGTENSVDECSKSDFEETGFVFVLWNGLVQVPVTSYLNMRRTWNFFFPYL